MFESLNALPADPLLGLIEKYRQDPSSQKVDLGVGIYKNEHGDTPVLESVKLAERLLLENENSKAYVGPRGNEKFNELMGKLVFGSGFAGLGSRLAGFQMPGGCGALRVLAETMVVARASCKVWVSDPTWVNHVPLLGNAGVKLETYPYYDFSSSSLRFDEMLGALAKAASGDVILLHGCCHNPSGADLSEAQWREVIDLCGQRGLIPFIDIAYQGFGDSLDQDAYGLRLAAELLPEVLVAVSCSKNFGLYRERVGAAFVLSETAEISAKLDSHLRAITRGIYSMPPSHGASIVAEILDSEALSSQWLNELEQMRSRIIELRSALSTQLAEATQSERFDFIKSEKGMFSFLGIRADQVAQLAKEFSVYMAESSRVNVAGINSSNLSYVVKAIIDVLGR